MSSRSASETFKAASGLVRFAPPWTPIYRGQMSLQSDASVCGRVLLHFYLTNSIIKLPAGDLSNSLVSCGDHVGVKCRRISLTGETVDIPLHSIQSYTAKG